MNRTIRRRLLAAAVTAVPVSLPVLFSLAVAVLLVVLLASANGPADQTTRLLTAANSAAGASDCPPAAVTGTAPGLETAQQVNAQAIAGVALGRGLGATGAAIGVAAALAESSLYNYANDGSSTLIGSAEGRQLTAAERAVARESLNYPHDRVGNNLDSIGLFQQRPMTGWGSPAELIVPAIAAGKFFDRMIGVGDWQIRPPWTVAQAVQGSPSSDGGIYRDSYQRAVAIVAAYTSTGDALTGSPTSSAATPSVVPVLGSLDCGGAGSAAAGAAPGDPAAPAAGGGGSAAWGGHQNGRIPASALCPVPSRPALQLECGAAAAFAQLNGAFRAQFGQDIGITDGYRSYEAQVACRLEKGSLCANPGTSNHGWGKAVDIGACCAVNSGAGPAFTWLTQNAATYGWIHPPWARPGGSKPEPWHWEYGSIS